MNQGIINTSEAINTNSVCEISDHTKIESQHMVYL